MTPAEAEDLAARTRAAIDALDWLEVKADRGGGDVVDAHTAQIASDLAGLQSHTQNPMSGACQWCLGGTGDYEGEWPCPDHARYADGLRRTAALYGIR